MTLALLRAPSSVPNLPCTAPRGPVAPQPPPASALCLSCSDIRKAEPQGIRYYYMFKIVSLTLSLLVFMLTSDWTSPGIKSEKTSWWRFHILNLLGF